MPTNVQDLPAKEVNVLNKNTGFPEPLSPDRNTTLPHPDADTSPNATIEAPDIDLTRTISRNSFLHRRHQSKNSFGKIGVMKDGGLYDNAQFADSTREVRRTKVPDVKPPEKEKPIDSTSLEKGATNGVALTGGVKSTAENGYTNGAKENGYSNGSKENGQSNGEKKKGGLFKRLSLQR